MMATPQPLSGLRVVVTRQNEQAGSFADRLIDLGAEPVLFPTIDFELLLSPELDQALDCLNCYAWVVFTSPNAVRFFMQRMAEASIRLDGPRLAATGTQTAAALEREGYRCDFVPSEFSGASLAASLPDLTGRRVLVPRTEQGRPELTEGLLARGALVDDIAVYRTVIATPAATQLADLAQGTDLLTFTSPLTLRNFFTLVEQAELHEAIVDAIIACIGPTTAAEARRLGLTADLVADEYTTDGLLTTICAHYQSKREVQ
jgi:uroporphyrinogen-III synthase